MRAAWMLASLLGVLACDGTPPPAQPARTPATARAEPAQPTPEPPTPEHGERDERGLGSTRAQAFEPPGPDGWGVAAGLRYLEHVHGGAAPDARLPLVVMIHGLGDRPRPGWLEELPVAVRVVLPQAPEPYGSGFSWFPYRVGDGDSEALARGIARAADRLADAIAVLQRKRPTLGKPIVGGFSQGGMLSYALALRHGALFSLAHPISGMLPRPLWPERRVPAPPIRALHGDADSVVPHAPDSALVEHLRALGYDVELELFAGVGHRVTPAMGERMTATLVAAAQAVPR